MSLLLDGQPDVQGVQQPRISSRAPYVSSAGDEAIELAQEAGLYLDPWQQAVLRDSLGERSDGTWASFEVGLVVPRQNGKGSILEARELAGLFIFDEQLIVHSAHEQKTASNHFRRMEARIKSTPSMRRKVAKILHGKGDQAIELKSGQMIFFQTRTGGGGRGLTADCIVLDEAMILPESVISALTPTLSARSMESRTGVQIWYTGSAVDKLATEHGVVLSRVRQRGIKGSSRLSYFEWSAPGDDPGKVPKEISDSPQSWAGANPGLGMRISVEHVANERAGALGPRSFAIERLGIGDWPDPDGTVQVISPAVWTACADPLSQVLNPVCLAFDVTPDHSSASIAAAGKRQDGRTHIEVIEHGRGTNWVVDELVGLKRRQKPAAIVCDAIGPAGSLLAEAKVKGLKIHPVNTTEHAQACGRFVDDVSDDKVRHLGTTELADAVASAVKRQIGDGGWAWSRLNSSVDISPLVAVTLAKWGFENKRRQHRIIGSDDIDKMRAERAASGGRGRSIADLLAERDEARERAERGE